MGAIQIRNAGIWKYVSDAWVRDAGVWKQATEIWFRYNGSWVKMLPPEPVAPGEVFGGGYYVGKISTAGNGVATHYLVVAPKVGGASALQWKTTNTSTTGTSSVIDGPTNTTNMDNASHPAAQFCAGLTLNGYSDWYMPAKEELEICYFNFKSTTLNNSTSFGANNYSIPQRPSNYSLTTPAQTTVTDFKINNSESFVKDYAEAVWWSSTQYDATSAWGIYFYDGFQYNNLGKISTFIWVRAVRRVAI